MTGVQTCALPICHLVKVLGNGEISVKVTVEAHAFSSSAEEKISAAGGSAKKL